MIWSRVSWDGPGPLVFVDGTMDGPKYLRLLHRHVLDHCIEKMGENGEPHVFMDDGATVFATLVTWLPTFAMKKVFLDLFGLPIVQI